MIGTATRHFKLPGSESAVAAPLAYQRRRISHPTARALEKLAHAIEYLTSEFLHQDAARLDGRLEAIELLRDLNRDLYFTCPQPPTLRHRAQSLLQHLL